ncbi:hypothetical protein GJ496_001902 [Pomphorhynchus laevis]|nr:hypothetical protein GJ496_001902 [Pomphorhynchus laevis]
MHSLLDIYEVAGVDIKDMINKLRCYAAELLERFDAIKDQVGIAPFCLALQVICKDGGLYVDNTYVCRYSLWDRYAVRSEYKSCDDLKGKLIEANVLKCHHGLKRCKLHRRWHYAKLAHHNSRDEYKYLNEVFPFASAGDESHTRVDLATICFSITTNKKLCDDEAINVVFTICPLGTYNSLVTAPPIQISASDNFSKYYRGVLIDEGNVSSDLQGTLGISKALAGYLTSAVTMGPAEISWKAFMLSDGSVNLISLDPLAADVVHSASDILHTIEAGQLVLNNSEYTLAELAIVRLIANGLPRFAAPADAINIPILDNFVTLRFDVTILYHEAVPVIPFAVPTYYSIGSILTKLAFKTSTSDDYLSGLVMAIAVSFFYQGQGNLNCIVNAFAVYRRLKWLRPIFKNLLYAWLRLNNQTEHIAEKLELASALKGPLVEIVQSFILTNMIISTATSTIFHRWSASANLLQMYMTRAANANYGSTAVYLEAHLEAPYNETSASFFSAVYLAIKDLCYDDLPIGACNISRWNGGRGSVNADLANNEAWIGRWDRRIVYPCQPYTVLGLMSLGRQFGGTWVLQLHLVLARSVTLQNIPLPAESIEPALVYDAVARLVVVGGQVTGKKHDMFHLSSAKRSKRKMHSLLDIYEVAGVDIKDMINKLRCYAAELLERFDAIKDQVGIAPFCLALQVICKDGGLYVDNTYVCRYSLWDRYAVRSEYKSCDDLKGKLIEANVLKCHHGLKRCKLHRRWHYAKLAHHNSRDEYKYLNEVFPFASAGDESHTRVDLATICFSITTNKKLCDDEAINVVFTICPLGTYNSLVTGLLIAAHNSNTFKNILRYILERNCCCLS